MQLVHIPHVLWLKKKKSKLKKKPNRYETYLGLCEKSSSLGKKPLFSQKSIEVLSEYSHQLSQCLQVDLSEPMDVCVSLGGVARC